MVSPPLPSGPLHAAASSIADADETLGRVPWSDRARVWAGMQARSLPTALGREIQLSAFKTMVRVTALITALGFVGMLGVVVTLLPMSHWHAQLWCVVHLVEYAMIAVALTWMNRRIADATLTLGALVKVMIVPALMAATLWGLLPAVTDTSNFVQFSAANTVAAMFAAVGFFWLFGVWPLCVMFSSIALFVGTMSYSRFDHEGGIMFGFFSVVLLSILIAISAAASHALFHASYDAIVARDRKRLLDLLLRDHERGGLDFLWETDERLVLGPIPSRMQAAAGGDERVQEGKPLLDLIDDPDVRRQVQLGQAFDVNVVTSGPGGDGELRLSGQPRLVSGNLAGFQGIGTDAATEQRAAAAERIEERLETMVTLTGGLAHDFNNQLATVLGAVELVALDPGISDKSRDLLERAGDACFRTRRITADLVMASGHSATYQSAPFEIGEAVRQVIGDVGPLYPAAPIEMIAPSPIWVEADRMQYMRTVRNLIENGCQAVLDPDHSSGRAPMVTVQLWKETRDSAEWAYTEVSDTGPGLSDDVKTKLFEPFFTTRRGIGGTGLGLSIARGFAHQANGSLVAESTNGARFRLAIPAVDDPGFTQVVESPTLPSIESTPSIAGFVLVVEDDPRLAMNVRETLENFGARVEVADSVSAAVNGYLDRAEELDGVVSDVDLPDGEGFDVIAALRSRVPGLKAVYMSGYARTLPGTVAPELQCPFLPKPFSSTELVEALNLAGIGTVAPTVDR